MTDKQKHNIPRLMELSKSNVKRESYSYKRIKKQERSQINNLTLQFKELEKELNPKLTEKKK